MKGRKKVTKIVVNGHQIEVSEEVIIRNGEVRIRNIHEHNIERMEKKIDKALYHQRIESELDKIFIVQILKLFGMKV